MNEPIWRDITNIANAHRFGLEAAQKYQDDRPWWKNVLFPLTEGELQVEYQAAYEAELQRLEHP